MPIILILLVFSSLLSAKQYILSYRSISKAHHISYENFQISRAMRPKTGLLPISSLSVRFSNDISVKKLLLLHQDKIHDMMFKAGILLSDDSKNHNAVIKERTVLTMPPRYVDISVKGDFATITLLK
jgi:hypothetical protein